MKKLNISSQLFVIVLLVVLSVSLAFSFLAYSCLNVVIEKEVYSRLETYASIIDTNYNDPHDSHGMSIGYIVEDNNQIVAENINGFLTESQQETIMRTLIKEAAKHSTDNTFFISGEIETTDGKIFYTCKATKKMNDFSLVFTDDSYSGNILRVIVLQIILIFLIFTTIACAVILLWSNAIVRRIKKLQNHIINLPRDQYEHIYVDDAEDEIGELSRSVELMRQEINKNEHTKQEMLQNLSHDFKTPIAVIKSYAESIEDGLADESTGEVITTQADLLARKVNKLLQYNSLEYLEKDREFEPVLMNEIVLEVVQNYKFQTKLEFELKLDEDVYFIGYRENFYTVVDNVIDNAKRYAKTKIKIVLKQNRLRIYNDGEHLDDTFIKNGFKPYEKGSKGQFGLGMSIVQRTVEFFGYKLIPINEEVGVSIIIEK